MFNILDMNVLPLNSKRQDQLLLLNIGTFELKINASILNFNFIVS